MIKEIKTFFLRARNFMVKYVLFRRVCRFNKRPSPETYDRHEQIGAAHQPIPVLMAYKPVSYQLVNFPIHIHRECELLRYIDHNYEGEVPALYHEGAEFPPVGYVNSFTYDEYDLINKVRDSVAKLSRRRFGRQVRPATNLLVQSGPFRMVKAVESAYGVDKLSVFEIGPGAGYLGAMLAANGHKYFSFDVTQSYYLWQNRLLAEIAGRDFTEMSCSRRFPIDYTRVVHLPWWIYVSFLTSCPVRVDMVYSNSNLCEMSPLALKIALTVSKVMLSESPVGLFTFFSHGMPAQTPPEELQSVFESVGYTRIEGQPFEAYALNPESAKEHLLSIREKLPHFDPSGRGGSLTAREVVPFKEKEAPIDTTVAAWNLGWEPPYIED